MTGRSDSQSGTSITKVTVQGFKSIAREQSVHVRNLTILAGANSSGKSSIMQPLLLMKQTLDESYDPGPILLSGPLVKFSSPVDILSKLTSRLDRFTVGVATETAQLTVTYARARDAAFEIEEQRLQHDYYGAGEPLVLRPDTSESEMLWVANSTPLGAFAPQSWSLARDRCFLYLTTPPEAPHGLRIIPADEAAAAVQSMLYLPGLRGNPERAYPLAASGPTYPGPFQAYTASVIAEWQRDRDSDRLAALREDLRETGLASTIEAGQPTFTAIELRVGRPGHTNGKRKIPLVNIADVGLGVSQTLPVLVALHVAKPGQVVYIEQPETHLHPRAQSAMARVLVRAANRGVKVVAETHSPFILLGVQTAVASGAISADSVALHWFSLDKEGATRVTLAEVDENGAYGKWPEDFGDVLLDAQAGYLDAAEARLAAAVQ